MNDRTAATVTAPTSHAALVGRHVSAVVRRLQGGYLPSGGGPPTSGSVQGLAALRRALGSAGARDPRVWAIVLEGMPDELAGPSGGSLATPTRAEQAVFTALTTYAVHQQSQRRPMHVPGVNLGHATRDVARQRDRGDSPGGLDDATVQRLHRVSMAQTVELRAQALRALVTLMSSVEHPVGVDYARLAQDLYWMQDQSLASRIHLAWGRGLHSRRGDQTTGNKAQDTDNDAKTETGEDV